MRAPARVRPSIAFSRERPARIARPASRRKKRESTMPSSVWKPNGAPAFSSAAPLPNETSAVSSLPPGASTTMIELPITCWLAAICGATFQASLTCCSTTRKPNSSASRSAVRMSSCRWVWKCTMRFPSSTSPSASIPRSRAGAFFGSAAASASFFWYSCALTNCSRTSAADLARVPGNGGGRLELVPFAIFMPPVTPRSVVSSSSSIVLRSRSLR